MALTIAGKPQTSEQSLDEFLTLQPGVSKVTRNYAQTALKMSPLDQQTMLAAQYNKASQTISF